MAAVHETQPDRDETRGVFAASLRQMACRQRKAVAFSARIANGNAVNVGEPGQHAAVEQRQRRPVIAAIPQHTRGDADVIGKAFWPNVEVLYVNGWWNERCLVARDTVCAHDSEYVDDQQCGHHDCPGPENKTRRLFEPAEQPGNPSEPCETVGGLRLGRNPPP
jgi:hypothetical protein